MSESGFSLADFLYEYRKTLIGLFLLVVVGAGAFVGYQRYHAHQMEKAAVLYNEMTEALASNNAAQVQASAATLLKDYRGTPYALFARLYLARADADAGKPEAATKELQAFLAARNVPPGLAPIAHVALARAYLQMGQPQKALEALGQEPPAFAPLYEEVRGDAFAAQRQWPQARQAYQAAVSSLPESDPYRGYLELKLANLGVGQ